MAKRKYGVLRGRVVATAEEQRDEQSPHYQIMVIADGVPWRIAVNVKSTDTGGGADSAFLLYRVVDDFHHPMLETVKTFQEGFSALPSGPDKGGLDFIRSNLFDPKDMRLLPPNAPGADNDLNELIDSHVGRAKDDPNAVLFAFGLPWGPENKPDKTFQFKPNRGVHDIHMNQGNPLAGGHAVDNGVWQDGGMLLWFPDADRWVALFLAFQSQSWHTDDRSGDPIDGATGAEALRFDAASNKLPPAEQIRKAIELIAVRVRKSGGKPPAVLLLNTSADDVDLGGWSVAISPDDKQAIDGNVAAGAAIEIALPKSFFRKAGGGVTILNEAGLKVTGALYPAASKSESVWTRTA